MTEAPAPRRLPKNRCVPCGTIPCNLLAWRPLRSVLVFATKARATCPKRARRSLSPTTRATSIRGSLAWPSGGTSPIWRKTLFKNRIFASILHSLNAIPIDQEGVSTEGLKALVDKVRQGHAVVIFPEGSRTPDGVIHPLRPGIQLLIKRTGAPIIPVGIAGAMRHGLSGETIPCWPRCFFPPPPVR